jgi:hypothetical protein
MSVAGPTWTGRGAAPYQPPDPAGAAHFGSFAAFRRHFLRAFFDVFFIFFLHFFSAAARLPVSCFFFAGGAGAVGVESRATPVARTSRTS